MSSLNGRVLQRFFTRDESPLKERGPVSLNFKSRFPKIQASSTYSDASATVKARNVKTRQKSALFGSSEKAAKDRRGLSAFSTSRSCDSSCRVGAEAMLFEEHLRTSQLAFSLRQNTWRQARLCSISRVTVRSFAHEHRPAG